MASSPSSPPKTVLKKAKNIDFALEAMHLKQVKSRQTIILQGWIILVIFINQLFSLWKNVAYLLLLQKSIKYLMEF